MRVAFQAGRIVIIDHMADVAEVESSTGNVRGNHEANPISAKPLEDRGSPRLVKTSVDIPYGFKPSFQLLY
jgi:hypothetical protein